MGYAKTIEEGTLALSNNVLASSDVEEACTVGSFGVNKYFTLVQSVHPQGFIRFYFEYKNLVGTLTYEIRRNGTMVYTGSITMQDWKVVQRDEIFTDLKIGDVIQYCFNSSDANGLCRNCRMLGAYSPWLANQL